MTVQNRIFFTYLYLDNTTGMTHLKTYLRCWLMLIFCILESCKCDFLHIAPFVYTKYILNNYGLWWLEFVLRSVIYTKPVIYQITDQITDQICPFCSLLKARLVPSTLGLDSFLNIFSANLLPFFQHWQS